MSRQDEPTPSLEHTPGAWPQASPNFISNDLTNRRRVPVHSDDAQDRNLSFAASDVGTDIADEKSKEFFPGEKSKQDSTASFEPESLGDSPKLAPIKAAP